MNHVLIIETFNKIHFHACIPCSKTTFTNPFSYVEKVNLEKSQTILQKQNQHETYKAIRHNLKNL